MGRVGDFRGRADIFERLRLFVVNQKSLVSAGARAAAWIMDSPRLSIGTRRRTRWKVASNRSTSSPRVSANEFLLRPFVNNAASFDTLLADL